MTRHNHTQTQDEAQSGQGRMALPDIMGEPHPTPPSQDVMGEPHPTPPSQDVMGDPTIPVAADSPAGQSSQARPGSIPTSARAAPP